MLLQWQSWHQTSYNLTPRQAIFLFILTALLKQPLNHLRKKRSEKEQIESVSKILTYCLFSDCLLISVILLIGVSILFKNKFQPILSQHWEMKISLAMKYNSMRFKKKKNCLQFLHLRCCQSHYSVKLVANRYCQETCSYSGGRGQLWEMGQLALLTNL